MNPYVLTILANFSFALGSQFFTHYARKFSSVWMNTFKATVATVCFLIVILFNGGFHATGIENVGWFFLSGFIALGLGDIFLLSAFAKIGPGRTLLLFGFHPLIVGVISYIKFGQEIDQNKLWAILFFIGCLITFSYESFKLKGKWEVSGLLLAFLGMLLDAVGITITRYGFDSSPLITPFEGNFYRCIGALICYVLVRKIYPFDFRKNLKILTKSSLLYVTLGSFLGTFLALAFYLEAIKTAHLASITAISITSVIFSACIECIWERKLPNKFLLISFILFAFGMKLLIF